MNTKRFVLALIFCCSSFVCRAQIESMPWSASNVSKLNKLSDANVVAFLNRVGGSENTPAALHPEDIRGFRWVDLKGDGSFELVLLLQTGPNFASVGILSQETKGTVSSQSIPGEMSLNDGIKDLDGDGQKEIIVNSFLDPTGLRGANPTPVWPQVYRLKGEKFVPASKEFSSFYELDVLPRLDKEIAQSPPDFETGLAVLQMQRDKILRVLGTDREAGLVRARQWVKSENPEMILNAVVVFRDMGGHEEEAQAAEGAERQACRHWLATHHP